MGNDTLRESNRDYHADFEYVGHSMAAVAMKSTQRFNAIYVAKTLLPDPPTPDMVLGSLFHTLTLTPTAFDDEFLIAEGCKMRQGKRWDGYHAEAEETDRTAVMPAQVELAKAMREAVFAEPEARVLLEAADPIEESIRWVDPATGIKRKAKPDFLVLDGYDWRWCVDLKSAVDATEDAFCVSVFKWGYHDQGDWYLDACKHKYADLPGPWIFAWIVPWKTPPHDVYVYHADSHFLAIGAENNAVALARLRDCYGSGDWRAPGQKKLQTLKPKHWMKARG
jgi:hypothetical protein